MSYLPTLIAVLQSALTCMDLCTGQMMKILHATGYKSVAPCAADEAFMLGRMMRAALSHRDNWDLVFTAQSNVAPDVEIEKHEAAKHQRSA